MHLKNREIQKLHDITVVLSDGTRIDLLEEGNEQEYQYFVQQFAAGNTNEVTFNVGVPLIDQSGFSSLEICIQKKHIKHLELKVCYW